MTNRCVNCLVIKENYNYRITEEAKLVKHEFIRKKIKGIVKQ